MSRSSSYRLSSVVQAIEANTECSLRSVVFKYKQDGVLDKNRMVF
jgi:hypothetical protein